jgi:hypothetical protein
LPELAHLLRREDVPRMPQRLHGHRLRSRIRSCSANCYVAMMWQQTPFF